MKMGHFPSGDPPEEKVIIFAKMPKIMVNTNIRGCHYFAKKVQNSRKTFLIKITQFVLSVNRSGAPQRFHPLPL